MKTLKQRGCVLFRHNIIMCFFYTHEYSTVPAAVAITDLVANTGPDRPVRMWTLSIVVSESFVFPAAGRRWQRMRNVTTA